jgi:hypothetical protein
MKKKKWPYVIGIILIVGSILFLYTSFNGNPLSKWKAKQIAIKYLNEVYEENEFWYHETNFNFKDNSYFIRYSFSDLYSGTIEVGHGLWPSKILYTHINDDSPNEELDTQINDKARTELLTLLEDYPILDAQYSSASPSTLGYTLETFSIYEKTPFKPNILINLTKENRSKEEAKAIVQEIQKAFNEAGVHYLEFQVQQDKVENNDLLYAFDVTKTTITWLK